MQFLQQTGLTIHISAWIKKYHECKKGEKCQYTKWRSRKTENKKGNGLLHSGRIYTIHQICTWTRWNLFKFEWLGFLCILSSIAFYTGLKKGKIHALKWTDIDRKYLNVTRSISQKLRGKDRETAPKNKSSIRTRQLPIPLIKILEEHKKRWSEYKGFNDNFRICGVTRPLRDTSLAKMNEQLAKSAGLKTIRIMISGIATPRC